MPKNINYVESNDYQLNLKPEEKIKKVITKLIAQIDAYLETVKNTSAKQFQFFKRTSYKERKNNNTLHEILFGINSLYTTMNNVVLDEDTKMYLQNFLENTLPVFNQVINDRLNENDFNDNKKSYSTPDLTTIVL